MKCPFCGAPDTRVLDSRPIGDDSGVRRRRHCEVCGRRFTTYERAETFPIVIVKKDNTREPYNRHKIEAGIVRACHKRQISMDQINEVIDQIENELYARGEQEVPSSVIGEMVLEKLRNLDEVAYIRFASVYREFRDVSGFTEELKHLSEEKDK